MLYASIALFAVVFILLARGGILHSRNSHRAAAEEQLQSIAQLKVTQIEDWLKERLADSRVVQSSALFSGLLSQWRQHGDPAARASLLERLEAIHSAYGYRNVLVCDAQGEILLQVGMHGHALHAPGDTLRDTVRRAIASGETLTTELFRMAEPSPEHTHLDFVAPLVLLPGQRAEAAAAIVLRADVEASLYAYLQSWPVPSASAEVLLFRREGDSVRYLNELRHRPGTALKLRLPLSSELLAAQALAPDYRVGALLEGVDYRGVPALGVAQPVAGTPWWVVAKIDQDEILGVAHQETLWIAFAGLLTWVVSVTLAMLLFERRELRHAQQKRYEQAEKLRALKLLSEIADASVDGIFAKDRQSRYLMFNRAASGFAGKSEDQVIGQDDSALFPAGQAAAMHADDQRVMDENRVLSTEETLDTAVGTRTFLTIKGPLHGDDGRVIGMYGISRDITERKTSEEILLRSNEELQRFNRAMVGRELEMIKLKREVNELAAALKQPPPYDLSAFDEASGTPTEDPA
jgi:PAS domain S-box-containing protein